MDKPLEGKLDNALGKDGTIDGLKKGCIDGLIEGMNDLVERMLGISDGIVVGTLDDSILGGSI